MDEVTQHADAKSCWTAINGKVYDVTPFFGKHKGGDDKLLMTCGKDATPLFEKVHGGQAGPEMVLGNLVIGTLK